MYKYTEYSKISWRTLAYFCVFDSHVMLTWMFVSIFTLGFNEQIFLQQNHWLQCKKVRLQRAPTCNEQFLLYPFSRCKRDPVYLVSPDKMQVEFSLENISDITWYPIYHKYNVITWGGKLWFWKAKNLASRVALFFFVLVLFVKVYHGYHRWTSHIEL